MIIKKIDDEIVNICKKMIEANYKYNGIALAANQVGINYSIVALTSIEPFKKIHVY